LHSLTASTDLHVQQMKSSTAELCEIAKNASTKLGATLLGVHVVTLNMLSRSLSVAVALRGQFVKFVDWPQCAAVMQRETVTVMPSSSGGGNVVVA
jgi:hypothetical protein